LLKIKLIPRATRKAQLILGFFLACFIEVSISETLKFGGMQFNTHILKEISESHRWSRLVGFSDSNFLDKEQRYFLTDISSFDLYKELTESINEYVRFAQDKSQFFCRAPARALFLTYKLTQLPTFQPEKCHKYAEWAQNGNVRSISLLYVTGYFKNPASFFGHTLLKFNSGESKGDHGLLESSFNYGANTANDAALPYVIRGLTGAYSASLQKERFFRLSAQYQELQKRDVYEYRLDLSQIETQLIVAYMFEMRERKFKYYFMSDNCAYRLNLILGFGLNTDPMPLRPWSAPIDLLMGLYDLNVVTKIIFHPSQTSVTINAIERLSPLERVALKKKIAAVNDKSIDSNDSTVMSLAILETLNYLKVDEEKNGNASAVSTIDEKRKNVLLSLNDRRGHRRKVISPKSYPHEIVKPTRIKFGYKKINSRDPVISLALRGANFDLLDRDRTRGPNSEFVFLSPTIGLQNGRFRLDEITIFKVLSLNKTNIVIPGDSNFSWGVDLGAYALADACYPCTVARATGTLGKNFFLTHNASLYLLGNFSAHEEKLGSGHSSVSGQAGLLMGLEHGTLYLDVTKTEYQANSLLSDEVVSLAYKMDFTNTKDFTIKGKKSSNSWSLAFELNRYF